MYKEKPLTESSQIHGYHKHYKSSIKPPKGLLNFHFLGGVKKKSAFWVGTFLERFLKFLL